MFKWEGLDKLEGWSKVEMGGPGTGQVGGLGQGGVEMGGVEQGAGERWCKLGRRAGLPVRWMRLCLCLHSACPAPRWPHSA